MYTKIISDRIFTGYDFLPADSVLLCTPEGEVVDIVPREEAGEDILYLPGMVMPGMVNAHCHIELSHLKGRIPQKTGLVDFVQQVMSHRFSSQDEIGQAMWAAEDEMYEAGIVAVGDICNTADSIALKRRSRICWHNFIETTGFVPSTAAARFQVAQELASRFREALGPETVTIVPHASYSVSPVLFGLINEATDGQLISIHNQETPDEDRLFTDGSGRMRDLYKNLGIDISFFRPTGKSSLRSWLPLLNRGQKVIAVHNTCTGPEDLQFQQSHHETGAVSDFFYCICAGANRYIEDAMPPVDLLLTHGCRMLIGTDSYASNTGLQIWDEIQLIREQFPRLPENVILQWATVEGAAALGISERYGSFEKGKKPGVVHVSHGRARRFI